MYSSAKCAKVFFMANLSTLLVLTKSRSKIWLSVRSFLSENQFFSWLGIAEQVKRLKVSYISKDQRSCYLSPV